MMTATCNAPACSTAKPAEELTLKPRYAVTSDEHAYSVRVELPGVAKEDVSIDFEQDVLSLKAARKSAVPETWKPLHKELNHLGFALRLKLNSHVDEDKLTAKLEDGVLTLTLPIREVAKPRRIEVN